MTEIDGDPFDLLLKIAYGTLKLLPAVVNALTPGELTDQVLARVWVQQQQAKGTTPQEPMDMETRAAKLDDYFARHARVTAAHA